MILADENIHGFIIKTLREADFEVISVAQTAKGIKDENVIQLALKHGYLLLTSVLFLRYSFHEYKEIAQTLVHLLRTQALERPFFATITTKKIRIRQL